jgi:hypothetical protein
LNSLSVRNDLHSVLEPLDLTVILVKLDLELDVVVLHDVLAGQLGGELVRIFWK